MVNSYVKTAAREERRESDARIAERNVEVWEQILNETDQTPGRAFFEAVVKWCGSAGLTRDGYDLLCATSALPNFASKEWHRGDLRFYVEACLEKLRTSHNWDDDRLRDKAKELWNMSKPQVRAYLNKIQFQEVVRTKEQAEDWLRRHRLLESQRQYFTPDGQGPFPRLPRMVVAEGHVQARPLDAFFLFKILEVSGLRRYVARYGEQQINERVAATSSSLRGE